MLENRSMPPGIIIPELVYADVGSAVEWLCTVFGFSERLRIGNHRSQLCWGEASIIVVGRIASTGGDSRGAVEFQRYQVGQIDHSVMVRVEDVVRHYEHVKQHGARILHPPETYPFGERQYTVEDLGGHRWTFTQSVADVAPETWGGKSVVLNNASHS
jgi:uncharacterized glyoxalase superfamily protein PhnB